MRFIVTIFFGITTIYGCQIKNHPVKRPNIILIYLDDLGYGDVSAYEAGKLNTPNIDKLANNGIRFTDGYAASATCTPSRYALLTGRYPWRNKNARILNGTAAMLIDTGQMTLPKILRNVGYKTGIVGKWHLGLGNGLINWNLPIYPGPNDVGFDYSFIMAATQDRVPTVYIENGSVNGLDKRDPIEVNYDKNFLNEPTGLKNPELLKMQFHHGHDQSIVNGISRIGFMKGGKAALWRDEDMADIFLKKAQFYIKKNMDNPFFLYYAMQQPHVPRTPHPRFVNKSELGPRGDVILEADWCIGELISTLEETKILENTLIILTSDNGPVLNDGYIDNSEDHDHNPMGPFRGGKYSLFQAGTRVPFISYWKDKINPAISNAVISQIDLLSSLAKLVGSDVRGEDSEDFMNVLLGKSHKGRNKLILEATSRTAYRENDWVMIPPYPGDSINNLVKIELGNSSNYQLYNLKNDPGEKINLANSQKQKLENMVKSFYEIRGVQTGVIHALDLK